MTPAVDAGELVARVRRRVAETEAPLAEALRADVAGHIVDEAVLAGWQRRVTSELVGAGPLEPLLQLPGVTDVLVNAPDAVWFDRGAGMERSHITFPDDDAVRRLAVRLAGASGRRLDDAMPFVDAVLSDGTRLHALLPPLAEYCTVSLRVFGTVRMDLDALVAGGAVQPVAAEMLRAVIARRVAFVVSGGTGAGKTTLLAALLAQVPHHERLVVIEDTRELAVDHPHVVRLATRGDNVEGTGAVGLRDLVRQALRMRPDRLVVGEFRGAELSELLVALNTGHEGAAATLHANSAADVPARFEALGSLAGLDAPAVASLVASAMSLVVQVRRGRDGRRRVTELATLHRIGDRLTAQPVWTVSEGAQPGFQPLRRLLGLSP